MAHIMRDAQGNDIFNPEKAADTPARFMIVFGVRLESRYGFSREYRTMIRMVYDLSQSARYRIKSIFCDSSATHSYMVEGIPNRDDLLSLEKTAVLEDGGHNGIWAGHDLWLDPFWDEPMWLDEDS